MALHTVTFSTHNINGFHRNKNFLNSRCCTETDTIQCLQEHWLRPPFKRAKGINELKHVHSEFEGYGASAMKNSIGTKVLRGRPYGGTGFIWHKKYANCIKPRLDLKHERITVLEISDTRFDILCINMYLPYLDSSRLNEQINIYCDTLGFVDNIINSHPNYEFILLGDFNCNIYKPSHPFTPLVRDLLSRHNLCCTFDLRENFDPNNSYTRTNYGSDGNVSLLDYIFVSDQLKSFTTNITINHFSDNLSDHLPVSANFELSLSNIVTKKADYLPANINWNSITDVTKELYSEMMKECLDSINVPFYDLLHGNQICNCTEHLFMIEKYFTDIVSAIDKADKCLPRSRPGMSKSFWNDELSSLKKASYDAHIMWRDSGKPSSGMVFNIKKEASYKYKHAVRMAKKSFDQELCDEIHDNLTNNQCNDFWKSWKHIHGKQDDFSTRINDKIDHKDIANEFATSFKRIYDEANSDRARQLTAEFETVFRTLSDNHCSDDISPHYLSWDDMVTIMGKLKPGKASGSFIKAEHVLYGSPQLVIHLHLLFNSMIQHGYVPSDFLKGVITPIIKDTEGDLSSVDNYRGITLSHVFSYLFEHAILLKIGNLLSSDDLQFGYKKRHSTSHAIYCLKQCINYFTDHGSHTFASFLDCTKGFDRVSHDGLFLKLIQRGVHLCWIRILKYWYSNLFSTCKWRNAMSEPFYVISGVRQGGVLSARFWAVYMDDLIKKLRRSGMGCHITNFFIACILYADDVCLLAPSRKSMQILLDICSDYAASWCIKYNDRKSKLMYFGKKFDSFSCSSITLNNAPLEFVSEWKYLGVLL